MQSLPGLRRGLEDMCVDEVRSVVVPMTKDFLRPEEMDSFAAILPADTKYLHFTVELVELVQGPKLNSFSGGLSFGQEPVKNKEF